MNDFKPDWVSPPSDTIRDILEERKIDWVVFAEMMEMSLQDLDTLLSDNEPYSEEITKKLSEQLGSTPTFWKNRDHYFSLAMRKKYREWEQLKKENESLKKLNASLNKRLDSYQRDSERRYKEQQDYLPYEDDPYDR